MESWALIKKEIACSDLTYPVHIPGQTQSWQDNHLPAGLQKVDHRIFPTQFRENFSG